MLPYKLQQGNQRRVSLQIQRFNMKFLQSGFKAKKIIVIDNEEAPSDAESDISEVNTVSVVQQTKASASKFKLIAPIRRVLKIVPKPHVRGKVEEIEIHDSSSSQPSAECVQRMVSNYHPPPQEIFKKRLVKVSNKCKIEGKQYSSTECSICLSGLESKDVGEIGRLDCKHSFCFDCILQSSKFSNRCPYCRASFNFINRKEQIIPVEEVNYEEDFDPYQQPCYVCGRNDDFDHLLECEYCQSAFCHTYCDNRLQSDVPPEESWYCLSCSNLLGN